MVVNGRPMKRAVKRRVTADLSDFLTFPTVAERASPAYGAPFRTAVRELLTKNALLPPPSSLFPHLMTWQVLFRVGDLVADDGGPPSSASTSCRKTSPDPDRFTATSAVLRRADGKRVGGCGEGRWQFNGDPMHFKASQIRRSQ